MRGLLLVACAAAFQAPAPRQPSALVRRATCTPAEANKVVNLAKQAIGRDAGVKNALGALQRVENILGSGSPAPGAVAVSFSASFRRQGNPFKLAFGKEAGATKVANRGSNVSQIKARADGGKLVSCSIQMDGGWGRTINVRCFRSLFGVPTRKRPVRVILVRIASMWAFRVLARMGPRGRPPVNKSLLHI